ncbi:RdgB/HAM1 family non-canonical purine NTP pyrophosphatase [Pseudorhodobacter aquimaris]|uniref:RdgB/HAM1 family non-canonical purine NTP pyrophosphatase n=1 Tax=Pseudorhodobacter aquimaris TaxID=687412 RepID=UPI00067CEDA0|nr:RdgB/HAM1 family non-canonical purine NTP pyrophosphatase [Pseudorhodobacter aquimaris]
MRKFTEQKLLVATHNAGKLAEIADLLKQFNIEVISAGELGLPEPDETEDNFVGNARIKAHTAARASGLVTLADDSGICIDALGGAPGVYTADWAETPNGRDFHVAMDRTWQELEAVNAPYPRHAQFCCTLVMAWPDGHDEVFEGVMPGTVVWPKRGELGHGYDPIFQPSSYNITFAEMSAETKNAISHRADAFKKLVAGCFT